MKRLFSLLLLIVISLQMACIFGSNSDGEGNIGYHDVSGRIVISSGEGLADVDIEVYDNFNAFYNATSDADGYYTAEDVRTGTYHINPIKSGYTMSPDEIILAVTDKDVTIPTFTATPNSAMFTVSGRVITATGEGVAEIDVELLDYLANAVFATTDANGAYTFTEVIPGDYYIVPNKSGYIMNPVSRLITVSAANVTAPDFTAILIGGGGETTYTLTGTWIYSTSQPTVTGVCPAGSPITETCTITQTGESFSLTSSAGAYYGTISGAEYSGATPETVVDEEGGTIINTITFTAESADIAHGAATSLYTHPSGVTCLWEYTFSLTRQVKD